MTICARVFGPVLMGIMLVGHGLAQTQIPACPAGSQTEQWKDEVRPYIHYECKLPQKANNMEMCREWEGAQWSTTVAVPCGSRVSSAVRYTGTLKCPVSKQVYLWDSSAKTLSKDVSCLPPGWVAIQKIESTCPAGYISGSPALFGQDTCYGPQPAPTLHDLLSHDINGFKLGMTIKEVQAVAHQPLRSLGGGQYEATVTDVNYNFGFSILGHLYRIQFTAPTNDLKVANRELGTVESIGDDGRLHLNMDGGRAVELDPHRNLHLDYGYAVTSHSSQGQTADRVLINVDTDLGAKDLLNSRMAYVAVSRGAHDAQIFTNNASTLGQELSRDVSHAPAIQQAPVSLAIEQQPAHVHGIAQEFGVGM